MTSKSKLWIYAGVIIAGAIIATLLFQRDSGYAAIGIAFIYRPALQITLVVLLVVRLFIVLRERSISVRLFLLKLSYLVILTFVLASSFLFPNEIMYSREIIYFNLNSRWFERLVSVAPSSSNCSIPAQDACWENVPLTEDDQRDSHDVIVATYRDTLAIIVEDKHSNHYYVNLVGARGLPQLSLGGHEIGCDYQLNDVWYVCAVAKLYSCLRMQWPGRPSKSAGTGRRVQPTLGVTCKTSSRGCRWW